MARKLLKPGTISAWHVGVAAEAVAAALFARCGLDVSVQYGANQPEYDLIVAQGERMLKVSVKGSQDGGWGLTQSYLEKGTANYLGAADAWLAVHRPRTVLCFVQFKDVPIDALPRVYIASPREVAARLKETCAGHGSTILYETWRWTPRANKLYAGTVEEIPAAWRFSAERVKQLLAEFA